MLPYFIVYFLLLICCILGSITRGKCFLVLIFFILTFFSGFRFYVGVDYGNYVNIFNGEIGYESRELGFSLFLNLLHRLGASYQQMFLWMAIIMQFFVYKILIKYNYNVWSSVLIYYCISPFYIATFNGTRQYIAIAVFIWAIQFVEQRKPVKYFLSLLIVGLLFHESVLIFLPLYFVLDKKLTFKSQVFAFFFAFFCSMILVTIISYTPYIFYLTRERETHISSITYLFAFISLILIIFWNKINDFPHKQVMSNMNLFCFLSLSIALLQSNGVLIQMMLRMNSYFFFIYILLVPAIINSISSKKKRISMYFFIHIILFLYLVRTIIFNGAMYNLVPYSMNFNLIK